MTRAHVLYFAKKVNNKNKKAQDKSVPSAKKD